MAKNLSLNTNRRVLAVDLRNHGESPHAASHTYLDLAADIKYLMDELGIEPNKSSFIGNSVRRSGHAKEFGVYLHSNLKLKP